MHVATAMISFALGRGMLRWKPWARTAASWYFLFWLVNGMAEEFLPDRLERLAAFDNLMPRWFPDQRAPSPGLPEWFGVPLIVLLNMIPVYFLVSRKQAYLAVSNSGGQPKS